MKFTKGANTENVEWLRSRKRGISMLLSYDGDDTHVGWTARTSGLTQPQLGRILRAGNKALARIFRDEGAAPGWKKK